MSHYMFICSDNPQHVVYFDRTDPHRKTCQISGCHGRYAIVTLQKTGGPRRYKQKSITVKLDDGSRRIVDARLYSDRSLRTSARREELIQKLRRQGASVVVDETEAYLGDPVKFKGLSSRLSLTGHYAARPDLDTRIAALKAQRKKIRMVSVGEKQPRPSGGQNGVMGDSADNLSGRNLPCTRISDGHGGSRTPNAEEWCHLQAASLGGDTTANNLVSASYAANSYMMSIEMLLINRSDLALTVTAYCTDDSCVSAEAIRYRVYKGSRQVLDELIDATAQHFSKDDMEQVRERVKRAIGPFEQV